MTTSKTQQFIGLRPSKESDHAFIYATWLRNLWFDKNNLTTLSKDMFMQLHHTRIEKLLPQTVVACLVEDPDVIVGYRCADLASPEGAKTYLKKAWRNQGIEEMLNGTKKR